MVGAFFVYFVAFGLWEGAMLTLASVFVAVLLARISHRLRNLECDLCRTPLDEVLAADVRCTNADTEEILQMRRGHVVDGSARPMFFGHRGHAPPSA